MTLIYAEGWDQLAGLSQSQIATYLAADGWFINQPGVGGFQGTVDGPFGGKALGWWGGFNDGYMQRYLYEPVTTGKIIFGMRTLNNAGTGRTGFTVLRQGPTEAVRFWIEVPGVVKATVRGTTYTSGPSIITESGWGYLTVIYDIDDGSLIVKMNGDVVISVGATVTPLITAIDNWGKALGSGWVTDDIYIIKTDGTYPNLELGNVRVRNRFVNADGDTIEMTPVNAPTNWEAIQSPILTKTSYVTTTTVGDLDLYGIESGPDSRNIYGTYLRIGAWQADATQLRVSSLVKTNGTVFESTDKATQSSSRLYDWPFGLNPNTGINWTNSDINNLQIGGKLAGSD